MGLRGWVISLSSTSRGGKATVANSVLLLVSTTTLHPLFVLLSLFRGKIINFSALFELYSDNFHRSSKIAMNRDSRLIARFALNFRSRSARAARSSALTSAAAE